MTLATSTPLLVRPDWQRLLQEQHDVLVVGGGIHGAGVARDAALRGLRVALIEQGDWASGTSSRSSKLFHGGLRYLRQGSIRLVREALRERELQRTLAPDWVLPLPFRVVPSPERSVSPLVRAGVAFYGLLGNSWGQSRFWTREPRYEDATVDDARFCLQVVLDARRIGAVAVSYVEWLEWIRRGDHLVAARVRDRFTGEEGVVTANTFVNATGPWADLLAGESARRTGTHLRLTRGTHVVLDRRADDTARLFFAPEDGRVLFLLPFGKHASLLGTTDLDEPAPLTEPVPTRQEIAYLREAFRRQFPDWKHWRPVGVFCGLRPLLGDEGAPSDLSREERIVVDGSGNLLSIFGGKYTTFRIVAERAVDVIERWLDREPSSHPTRIEALGEAGGGGDLVDDLRRAFAEEDAVRLEDVFLRRTRLGHLGALDPELLTRALHLWRLRWGKSEAEAEEEKDAYLELQARRLGPLAHW
ncbi:MAG TPA: glycerol-3-phosphate dehydrogenase/oxidase [Candidatus Eisenbacteria bacterium]|nr:glycerol-3-phosphate dehydrogenase/oxidase [Candidatus Eisenbacteria bacterium]